MNSISESLLQSENNDLKRRVAELESKITTLVSQKNLTKTEITKLFDDQKTIAELQSQLHASRLEESRMRATLQAQETSLLSSFSVEDPMHKQILEMKNKLTIETAEKEKQLMQSLSVSQLEVSKLRNQICTTEANNADLLLKVNELQAKLDEIDGNGLLSGAERSRLKGSIGDLQGKYESVCKINISLKEQINEITNKYNKERNEYTLKINELTQQNAALKKNNERDAAKIQNLENQLSTAKIQISKFEERIKQIEVSTKSVTEKNQTADEEISRLTKQVTELNFSNERIKEENQKLQKKDRENQTALMNLELKLRETQMNENNLIAQINLLKEDSQRTSIVEQQAKQTASEKEETEKRLKKIIKEKDKVCEKANSLEQRINELEMELQTMKMNNQTNETQLEICKQENKELRDQMISYRNNASQLRKEVEICENKMKTQKGKKKQLKNEVANLRSELSNVTLTQTTRINQQQMQNEKKIRKLNEELIATKKANDYYQKQNNELMENIKRNRSAAELTGRQLESARAEIIKLTQKNQPQPSILPGLARKIVKEMKKRITKFNKLYIVRLSFLQTQLEQLASSFDQLRISVLCSKPKNLSDEERGRFLRQIELQLHVVDRIAHVAGKSFHIPKEMIPCATELLTNPSSLEEFLSKLKRKQRKCNHTDEDVIRALNFPEQI